jgi:cytochrome c
MERDIVEARKHMDLSRWELLSMEQQQVLLAKISHEAKSGDMPPLQYMALHWGAKLSQTDVQTLSALSKNTGGSEATVAGAGDAARGKAVFDKRCTGCHSMDINGEGPRLSGVYGRKAGSVPGFEYSQGLKNSGLTWNDATLEKWLSGPDSVVPDAKMDFYVPKAAERRDLIAYFKR